jgi:hypothetical protein
MQKIRVNEMPDPPPKPTHGGARVPGPGKKLGPKASGFIYKDVKLPFVDMAEYRRYMALSTRQRVTLALQAAEVLNKTE